MAFFQRGDYKCKELRQQLKHADTTIVNTCELEIVGLPAVMCLLQIVGKKTGLKR
jgi:hypothetical protein